MPDPKDNLKRSGDVHPPELDDDVGAGGQAAGGRASAELASQPVDARFGEAAGAGAEAGGGEGSTRGRLRGAMARVPALSSLRLGDSTERYLDAAREQVRAKPIALAATAFAIGFVLAIVTRDR